MSNNIDTRSAYKQTMSIYVEVDFLKEIDHIRGDIPRSVFIRRCVEEKIKRMKTKNKKNDDGNQ